MTSFSYGVFNQIRNDYIVNGTRSFLIKHIKKENPDLNDEEIIDKAKRFMYDRGCSIGPAEQLAKAIQKLDELERKEIDLNYSGSTFDKDRNKKIKDKLKEKEGLLKENIKKAERLLDERKGRKVHNTALDMIDGWITEHGLYASGSTGADLESCEKIYRLIKGSRVYERVRLPIRVDAATGAGIYIIGNKIYPGAHKIKGSYCQLAIFAPNEETDKFEIPFWDGRFENVQSAFDFFNGTVLQGSMQAITLDNNEAPQNTPEEFKMYFEHADEEGGIPDSLAYTPEEYAETENEFKIIGVLE